MPVRTRFMLMESSGLIGCARTFGKQLKMSPSYAGKTTYLSSRTSARDSTKSPCGQRFQHHRTGDALSRTTWMMVLGPESAGGGVPIGPMQSTDLVPTIGARMGFSPSLSQGTPVQELL